MEFPTHILNSKELAFDTETTGLTVTDKPFGFSISDGYQSYYYDVRHTPQAITWFNDIVNKMDDHTIICHNLSFDWQMARRVGMHFPLSRCVDTQILACLINEHEFSYHLDNLSRKYTESHKKGTELYERLAQIFGGRATKNVQMKNLPAAPPEVIADYANGDTEATWHLYQWEKEQIKKQNLYKIVEFEKEVTPIIIDTEVHGVRVDISAAEQAVVTLSEEIKRVQKELDTIAGFHCNPNPSKDIKKLFKPTWKDNQWYAIDGTPLKETPAGQASIGAEALREMKHPAAQIILDLRNLLKTRDTFLVGHVLESAYEGRVYPTINQTKGDAGGTGTGRLSYVAPALQQIPDRNKKVAEVVKKVFLPDEGHTWVDADMASFEVRIFAHLVGTPDIVNAYIKDPETDFHQYVSDITGLVRNATYSGQANAKQLNLSMIFNQGDGTTADKMGMAWNWTSFYDDNGKMVTYRKPGPEAEAVIAKYHAKLPGVKKLAQGCKNKAEERGYIFTRAGRHLRFPRKWKTYKASGLLIQATSADENKKNWVRIHKALQGTNGRLLLNTHDSYSMSMPIGREKELAKKVKIAVEKDRGLRVPLILEINQPGENWWKSKNSKRWM